MCHNSINLYALIVIVGLTGYPVNGQVCFQPQSTFVTDCQNKYNGIVNGGRCYFVAGYPKYTNTDWTSAWSACSAQGATLAQIHTSNELQAISTYLQSVIPSRSVIWINGGRDPNTPYGPSAINLNFTRYYDSPTSWNPLMIAKNTFFRLHENDDQFTPGANCIHIWGTFTNICDEDCSRIMLVLCHHYNRFQQFNLISGQCMQEVVIASYSASASADVCAYHCASQVWCRGFNWHQTAQICDLFPWYYQDTTNMITGVSDCFHYAYVP